MPFGRFRAPVAPMVTSSIEENTAEDDELAAAIDEELAKEAQIDPDLVDQVMGADESTIVPDEDDDDDDEGGNYAGDRSTASTRHQGPKSLTFKPPKHDIHALQGPLPFIAEMRKTLFEVVHPIELKDEEFEQYWPYIDNVWVRQHKAGIGKSGKATVDYFGCRLQRATYTPKKDQSIADPIAQEKGRKQRKKRIREGSTCQARLKVSRQEGLIPCLRVQRIGEHEHSHDLDYMDKLKRNSVVMDIARSEVMKGYMPASVYTVLREDETKLASIGGAHINRNDVRNSSQAWRATYTGELGVHPGYRYDVGHGISTTDIGNATSVTQPPSNIQSPGRPALPADTLFFPQHLSTFLQPYLPSSQPPRSSNQIPYVTLTYAASLDSFLALGPTIPTPISGIMTKAMTHHLRAHHDAILIGAGTAVADDPTLNCRIAGAGGYGGLGWSSQPRPVIIDPSARWDITADSKILTAARAGKGKGPWIIVAPGTRPSQDKIKLLTEHGGKYVGMTAVDARYRLSWEGVFRALSIENIKSVMIEGGAVVINELLHEENRKMVDSLIVTIAPTYLGSGGVAVTMPRKDDGSGNIVPALRFRDVRWQGLGEDAVMCGRINDNEPDISALIGA